MSGVAYRSRLLIAAALCGAILSSCGLPTRSDIQDGRRVSENVAPRARIVVNPPSVGATQEVIARDFIRAGTAFNETGDDGQVVGRSYLAPSSVDLWRPLALTTTVYDARTPPTIEPLPSDQVRVTITAVATIDDTGHYRELPPGTQVSSVFSMTKVQGEWRIRLPDDGFGLWINTDDFDRVFAPFEVNYVISAKRQLVPDVRWFPTGPRLPSALARAQLASVPDYLSGVVETAIPAGTRLAVDAVNVDGSGIATVTLTNSAQTIDPARRRPMWAQFLATLTQAPGVNGVSIEVQGIGKIPVGTLPSIVSSLVELGFDQPPTDPATIGLMRSKQGLERINPQTLDESGNAPAAKPAKPAVELPKIPDGDVSVATSRDGSDIAALSANRAELTRWQGATGVTVPSFGTALTNPMYGSDGRLWLAGAAGGAAKVWTLDGANDKSAPAEVSVPWLAGRQVVNVSVSPDATRVAVISKLPNDTDSRLDLAGIVRNDTGLPQSLTLPYRQGEPLTRFVDVTWLDQMTMAVLAREKPDAPIRPWRVDVGQGVGLRRVGQLDVEQTLIKDLPDATGITSRGGVRGLIVTTTRGVFIRAGNAWAQQTDASEIVVGGT